METLPPPPGVINSLRAGLDVVSTHIPAILLPVALDLWLWLGPHLSMKRLFNSSLLQSLRLMRLFGFSAGDIQNFIVNTQQSDRINVFRFLRSFPIGIPSLIAGKMPVDNPLGIPGAAQVSSYLSWAGWFAMLTLLGWIGGALYLRWISGAVLGKTEAEISPVRAVMQTVLFSVLCVAAFFIILPPVLLIAGLLYLLYIYSPPLALFPLFLICLFSSWVIVPLFFTPYGIFVNRQNALGSIFSGLRMARFTLPNSSMFVLSVFILYVGLNYLWNVPPGDSWMLLVGIAGHAFIATTLLAASFIYYRDMNHWLQIVFERLQQNQNLLNQ